MAQQCFFIEGMTCSGCERTLERAVSRLDGVRSVQADHSRGHLDVEFSLPCTADAIIETVNHTGYTVVQRSRRGDGVSLLVILLGLFVIARQLGWTEIFQAFPTVDAQRMGYAALFFVGLLTSVHCIAMCGGLNLAQSLGGENRHPLRGSLLYNLGRLTSYTLIGGVLGFIGERAAITLRVRGIIGLVAGGVMLVMGACMLGGFSLPRFSRLRLPGGLSKAAATFRKRGSFAVGLVNGFMPCGPLQSMQLYAIASGGFLAGAMSMLAFCLGTIPLVLLFGVTAGILKANWRKRMLQVGAALLVLMGLFTVQNNLALAGIMFPARQTGAAVSAVVDGDVQYVSTTLHPNGFDDIQVVAGTPVVWTIQADPASLNGCNNEVILPAFGQQVRLESGATTITFTPETAGSYPYSCWMGMLKNTIIVVEK